MLHFPSTLAAWKTPEFEATFKGEIARLHAEYLPLQPVRGSHVINTSLSAMLLSAEECAGALRIRAGVFFNSVIAGCSCADDPTPINELNEYCELCFDIDPLNAETSVSLDSKA